jgi:hypothetical protein
VLDADMSVSGDPDLDGDPGPGLDD